MRSLISNPVAAEDAFKGRTEQSDMLLAAVPYSSIADSTVQVQTMKSVSCMTPEKNSSSSWLKPATSATLM